MDHLNALYLRLSHEQGYLAEAKSDGERALRTVWVAGIEKEIAAELAFLEKQGKPVLTLDEILMSDDELLAELAA